MRAIVAVDSRWGIGKNNDLLFHIPDDMKYFREKTLDKVVVMGSNTLLSFPGAKPLPKRTNIVLWPGGAREDCTVCQSLEELKDVLRGYPSEDIYVVGGAMFYRTMLPFCEEVLVTKVDADGGAEVFFENLDERPGWSQVSASEPHENGGFTFRFCIYRNESPEQL